jgi:hypothetical protein
MLTIKKQTETKTETRVDPSVYQIGEVMELKAQEIAAKCDFLMPTINRLAAIKQEYEGGPFAVYFKVVDKMDAETLAELPDPNDDTGNNPGIYHIRVVNAKGKPVIKDRHFYKVMSDRIPGNVAKQQRIDMLELSMKDPVQFNLSTVPQDIKDMDKDRRKSEIARLQGELSTSRTNIVAAFELAFKITAVDHLKGVTCEIMYAVNDKGELMDGSDDQHPKTVENTKTPIVITTTVKGREAKDTTQLSLKSFKALRPAVAVEKGGSYQALVDSPVEHPRGKGEDEPGGNKPEIINTNDTFIARLVDMHQYVDAIMSDPKQTNWTGLIKLINGAGSDDLLVTVTDLHAALGEWLAKTHKAGPRYQDIVVKRAEAEAA